AFRLLSVLCAPFGQIDSRDAFLEDSSICRTRRYGAFEFRETFEDAWKECNGGGEMFILGQVIEAERALSRLELRLEYSIKHGICSQRRRHNRDAFERIRYRQI